LGTVLEVPGIRNFLMSDPKIEKSILVSWAQFTDGLSLPQGTTVHAQPTYLSWCAEFTRFKGTGGCVPSLVTTYHIIPYHIIHGDRARSAKHC